MHCEVKHSIELVPSSSLPNTSVYRRSILENEEIWREIQDLIDKDHICPNSSPYGSLVVPVPKKYGTQHMCINYWALNNISIKNRYTLPQIDELIESLKGVDFFTNLDLKSGYHQIPIESTDVWKTDFKTKEILFEQIVMHFGLANATATFMR